jgi:hypothetical protein
LIQEAQTGEKGIIKAEKRFLGKKAGRGDERARPVL